MKPRVHGVHPTSRASIAGLVSLVFAFLACDNSPTQTQPTPLPCTYDVSPGSLSFPAAGGSRSLTVAARAGCQWTALSDRGWMTIDAGGAGSGNGVVGITVAGNPSSDERTGTLTIAGQGITVRVDGQEPLPPSPPPLPPPPPPPPPPACEYGVAPVEIPACMSVPKELTTTITAPSGCRWTTQASAPWIALRSPSDGDGPATIRFTVSDNFDAPRQGLVMIRWPTPTAGQNVRVSQAGCRYAVSVTAIAVNATGGARSFDVLQQSDPLECGGPLQDGCLWTAETSAPWITISSPVAQRGDQRVSFVVAENRDVVPRSGVISVRDKTVTITQGGR
jgi:hypothetical protein